MLVDAPLGAGLPSPTLEALDGGAVESSTGLGTRPEPRNCDSCGESIQGEIMWRLAGGHWRYPFAYLCTLCGDSYVYGEV